MINTMAGAAVPFQWIELATLEDGQPFDGMAFGTFVDMLGREVELEADDAADFVKNTEAAIKATTTESGEVVGLPIDAGTHDKGDAAGWIVGVEMVGKIIRLLPRWTKLGAHLIGESLRRYFSPTVDMKNKTISGGALVNWPATLDEKGRVLLRPIELSSSIQSIGEVEMSDKDGQDTDTVVEGQGDDLGTQAAADVTQDGQAQAVDLASELRREITEQVRAEFAAEFAKQRREREVVEFATSVTAEGARRLPVGADEVARVLMSLDDKQRTDVQGLLSTVIEEGTIEFDEVGHGKVKDGKHALPEGTIKALDDGVLELSDLSNPILALGDVGQYDLSKWEK